jgi:hypothetical protein
MTGMAAIARTEGRDEPEERHSRRGGGKDRAQAAVAVQRTDSHHGASVLTRRQESQW